MEPDSAAFDAQREFWDALSGSRVSRRLGITAGDPSSADRFDDWFWNHYPYLPKMFAHWDESAGGGDVLEIGLGYGSMFRKLSMSAGRLTGLDIANRPLRLASATTTGTALVNGSALEMPFADSSFDVVVAIGSLHHTGDIDRALTECERVLRPGGILFAMLYYRYSYKQFLLRVITLPMQLMRPRRDARARAIGWFYDRDPSGRGAPMTVYVGKRDLRHKLRGFDIEMLRVTNVDNPQDLLPARFQRMWLDNLRSALLRLPIWRLVGLDLYVKARRRTSPDGHY